MGHGPVVGYGICGVFRLGRAGTAHLPDAGDGGALAIAGRQMALALGSTVGCSKRAAVGPLGHVAAGFLAQLCGRHAAVCRWRCY